MVCLQAQQWAGLLSLSFFGLMDALDSYNILCPQCNQAWCETALHCVCFQLASPSSSSLHKTALNWIKQNFILLKCEIKPFQESYLGAMSVESVKLLQKTTIWAVIFCLKSSLKTTNQSSQLVGHGSLLVLSGFDLSVNYSTDYTAFFIYSRSPFLLVYLDCGHLISEKRGDALAQNRVIPQQTASPLEFMDTGQTPCWSREDWCFLLHGYRKTETISPDFFFKRKLLKETKTGPP